MATRTIKYFPKTTTAKTVYLELPEEEVAWLKTELIRWLAIMTESDIVHDTQWKSVLALYWNKKTQSLPKSKTGPNSPATFVAGLINNLVFGSQRDITERQMEGIRDISNSLTQLDDTIDAIQFQIGIGV